MTSFGSEEVQCLLDRWGECARQIENADVVIRMVDTARVPTELDQGALREKHAWADYRKASAGPCRPDPQPGTARARPLVTRGRCTASELSTRALSCG